MRIIKPGKLHGPASEQSRGKRSQSSSPVGREIWDDYLIEKKGHRKKEYTLGDGNRMVPSPLVAKKPVKFGEDPRLETEAGEPGRESGSEPGSEPGSESFGIPGSSPAPKASSDYVVLEARLGYHFSDTSLLQRALTHRSALVLRERSDYERLEFLGDAVLDLSVAHLLSDRYPDAREGELSKMRAALVNTRALADIARGLDIGRFIRLGRGEFSSGGHERPSILADVTEAIIGAMYLDSNYQQAFAVIEQVFGTALDDVTPHDPKTELQEALHAAGSEPPDYRLELVEGPEHAPTFVTIVIVDNEIAGRGRGPTKKQAQQEAASQALAKLISNAPKPVLGESQNELIETAMLSTNIFQPPVS